MKLLSIILITLTIFQIKCIGVDLTASNFEQTVINSDQVWLVEYFSKGCGSCKEFEPIWDKTAPQFKKLKIGRVNIDNKNEMALAQKENVLDEGIPCVKLYYGGKGNSHTVMAGDVVSEKQLKQMVQSAIQRFGLKEVDEKILKNDL